MAEWVEVLSLVDEIASHFHIEDGEIRIQDTHVEMKKNQYIIHRHTGHHEKKAFSLGCC